MYWLESTGSSFLVTQRFQQVSTLLPLALDTLTAWQVNKKILIRFVISNESISLHFEFTGIRITIVSLKMVTSQPKCVKRKIIVLMKNVWMNFSHISVLHNENHQPFHPSFSLSTRIFLFWLTITFHPKPKKKKQIKKKNNKTIVLIYSCIEMKF